MVCLYKPMHLTKFSVKDIVYIVFLITLCVFLHVWFVQDIIKLIENIKLVANIANKEKNSVRFKGIKHVLLWDHYCIISEYTENMFQKLNCSVSNCVFSENRGLLGDYSRFDAILFNHAHLKTNKDRPQRRSPSQLYIFTTIESSSNEPACELYNDGFFNWTFTHRLDSDVAWNYFVVRNVTGDIVAPSRTVDWQRNNYVIVKGIRDIFRRRTKAAAWIVSHCGADSLRDEYLTRLQEHLLHFTLQIDVYGACSNTRCDNDDCEEMLRNNYHFYMAFENSFAEDYVTEKVLHGYNNYVVPIVFGSANYSRFLPPGSYINARSHHPYNLAKLIYRGVNDPAFYRGYFRWTNQYTIDQDPSIYHPLCDLCKALNSGKARRAPAIDNFRLWWNRPQGMKWCLPSEFWNETNRVNIDGKYIYGNNLY